MSVGTVRPPQRSFRYRVRLALLVVLLVTLPQLALTLYYLRQIRLTADVVASRGAVLRELEQVRTGVVGLAIPDALALTDESRQRLQRQLAEASDRARSIASAFPLHAGSLARFTELTATTAREVSDWHAASLAMPSFGAAPDMAGSLTVAQLDESLRTEEAAARRGRVLDARLALDRAIHSVINTTLDQLRTEGVVAEETVAHADRNLVTLGLLALVVMVLLLLALPATLVEPIRRLTRSVRSAGHGLSAAVADTADDELGELAAAVGETVEMLRGFDALKRDRIVEDGGKIEALLRHAGCPAAVLSSTFVVEAANRDFLALLGGKNDEDTPLPEFFGRSGDELGELLLRVKEHRHEATDSVELVGPDGKGRQWKAVVDVCRDRRARPTHLLLLLRPAG